MLKTRSNPVATAPFYSVLQRTLLQKEKTPKPAKSCGFQGFLSGGDSRVRTDDLLNAIQIQMAYLCGFLTFL
jgi:hypothetical protein